MVNHRAACPDCTTAIHVDALCRVQEHLKAHPGEALPADLAEEILKGHYQTLEEFKERRSEAALKGAAEGLRILSLLDHMQKARDEFDREHPGGGGPTYACSVG